MALSETEAQELEDWRALVTSAGFTRLLAHVDAQWGPVAQMLKIDEVLGSLTPGNVDGELTSVAQVRAAAKQIQRLVRWPEERVKQLTNQRTPALRNPIDRLRRIAR